MNNKFTIVLGDTPLTYDLVDSPAVDAWRQIMLDCKEYKADMAFSSKHLPTLSLQELSDKLTQTCDILLTKYGFILPIWSGVHDDSFDQGELNRLHEEFHRQEDELGRSDKQLNIHSPEFTELLQTLNVTIHRLESIKYKNIYCTMSAKYSHVKKVPEEKIRLEITPEIRDCFTIHPHPLPKDCKSVMYIGYHTVGKDLWSCFKDNDVELIRSGLLSPQLKISSEINFSLRSGLFVKTLDDEKIIFDKICDWIKENNLNEIIDMNDPINKNFVQPTVGYLSSRYTNTELISLFDNNDVTDYYFS